MFKISAASDSDVNVFSFSVRFIYSLVIDFSESKWFTVFQDFLLSITFSHPNFGNTFLAFFKRDTHLSLCFT